MDEQVPEYLHKTGCQNFWNKHGCDSEFVLSSGVYDYREMT